MVRRPSPLLHFIWAGPSLLSDAARRRGASGWRTAGLGRAARGVSDVPVLGCERPPKSPGVPLRCGSHAVIHIDRPQFTCVSTSWPVYARGCYTAIRCPCSHARLLLTAGPRVKLRVVKGLLAARTHRTPEIDANGPWRSTEYQLCRSMRITETKDRMWPWSSNGILRRPL